MGVCYVHARMHESRYVHNIYIYIHILFYTYTLIHVHVAVHPCTHVRICESCFNGLIRCVYNYVKLCGCVIMFLSLPLSNSTYTHIYIYIYIQRYQQKCIHTHTISVHGLLADVPGLI